MQWGYCEEERGESNGTSRTDGVMQILRKICLTCVCCFIYSTPSFTSHSHSGGRRKPYYATSQSTTLNVLSIYSPYPPTVHSIALWCRCRCGTHIYFILEPKHSTMTALSLPRGRIRERSWCLRDEFDAKAWVDMEARSDSSARIDEDGEDGAQKLYTSPVQDQGPKVRTLSAPSFLPPNTKLRN